MEKENNNNSNNKSPQIIEKKYAFGISILLRAVAVGVSLTSACLMLTNNQTQTIYGIQMVAKYSYSPTFKFMAVANVAVSGFALVSLFVSLILSGKRMSPHCYFLFFLHDLAVTSLELAACAAATAVGYVGRYGNSHAGWMPICDHFERFCDKGTVSVSLSYTALFFFLCLTIISAFSSRNVHHHQHQSFDSVES